MLQNIIILAKCTLYSKYIRTCILSQMWVRIFLSYIFLAHRSSKPLFPSFLLGLPFCLIFSIMTLLFTKVSQCPTFLNFMQHAGIHCTLSPRASLYPCLFRQITCKHLEGRWLCNTWNRFSARTSSLVANAALHEAVRMIFSKLNLLLQLRRFAVFST